MKKRRIKLTIDNVDWELKTIQEDRIDQWEDYSKLIIERLDDSSDQRRVKVIVPNRSQ